MDPRVEKLVPLSVAARLLRPNGRALHSSTVYRYISRGCSGVFLESIRVGGATYTSREAVHRFIIAVTAASRNFPSPSDQICSPASSRQQCAAESLRRELENAKSSSCAP